MARFKDLVGRLEMDTVVHYGTGTVNEIMLGRSTDVTFILFDDSFVFFKTNENSEQKVSFCDFKGFVEIEVFRCTQFTRAKC